MAGIQDRRAPAGTVPGEAAAPAPASGTTSGSSEPALAPAANQKQQACIDTYRDSLTPAQVNEYCAPGGILYGD